MKIIPNWPNDDGHMPTRNSKETVGQSTAALDDLLCFPLHRVLYNL